MIRRTAAVLFATLALCQVVAGETLTTTRQACKNAFPPGGFQFHMLEECFVDGFQLNWFGFGPAVGSLGPGSLFGGGIKFQEPATGTHQFTAKAMYSPSGFSLLSGNAHFELRPAVRVEVRRKGVPKGHGQFDTANARLDFDAARVDLHTQDFYGLGPDSSLSGHAVYREIDTWTGVSGDTPVAGGRPGVLVLGGEAKYLHPVIKGVSGDSLPSVTTYYGEALAPASMLQPDFAEIGAHVGFRTPTSRVIAWEQHELNLYAGRYFDMGSSNFSFTRVEASGAVSFDLLHDIGVWDPQHRWKVVPPDRKWWQDWVCLSDSHAHCNYGTFTLRSLVTLSYTGTNSQVPFYLQPTLGGTDRYGVDTLRGLVDYRLRDPNRLLTQLDFDKPLRATAIKGHGVLQYGLYAFVDAGNVAARPTELGSVGMRHDVGVGASLGLQNKIVLRLYCGFGAGEGAHPNAKAASAF